MEIEVEQSKLAKALGVVSRVAAGARATLPILSNVLIRVDNKKVTLTTTNLDMAVVDYLPTSDSKDGVITVPARLMADFVANLPKGTVRISVDGEKVICRAGKYSSTFNGALADDFPELPEIEEKNAVVYKMGVDEFKTGVSEVMVAASNDMTRPTLTGILFNTADGALYIAATDGYRMAERKFIDRVESEVKAIVPASSMAEVMRSLSDEVEEIEILFDESQVRFRLGDIEITSKLIDGSYPDYRTLIPEETKVEVVLERAELIRVVKLAALFARGTGGSIVCEAKAEKGVFSVASVANEFGENNSEMEAEISEDGKVILNSRYLMDALNVLEEDRIIFGISGGLQPVLLQNEKARNYRHIVMPLNQ